MEEVGQTGFEYISTTTSKEGMIQLTKTLYIKFSLMIYQTFDSCATGLQGSPADSNEHTRRRKACDRCISTKALHQTTL
jgi:hypothetical protein